MCVVYKGNSMFEAQGRLTDIWFYLFDRAGKKYRQVITGILYALHL